MSTVLLEVVTPDRLLLSEQVNMVIIRGGSGEIGILPRHAPLATTVQPGLVKVRLDGGEDYISVSGGFLEVRPDRITLLADAAEISTTLDVDRANRAKQRAEERLSQRGEGIDMALTEAARDRALRRLQMLEQSNATGNVFERVLSQAAGKSKEI